MSVNLLTRPPPEQPAFNGNRLADLYWRWVSRVTQILTGKEPLKLAAYTVATLPNPADWPRCLVIVTDETGGETLAFSDGARWRRATDLDEVM